MTPLAAMILASTRNEAAGPSDPRSPAQDPKGASPPSPGRDGLTTRDEGVPPNAGADEVATHV